jgi:hypothetical protein
MPGSRFYRRTAEAVLRVERMGLPDLPPPEEAAVFYDGDLYQIVPATEGSPANTDNLYPGGTCKLQRVKFSAGAMAYGVDDSKTYTGTDFGVRNFGLVGDWIWCRPLGGGLEIRSSGLPSHRIQLPVGTSILPFPSESIVTLNVGGAVVDVNYWGLIAPITAGYNVTVLFADYGSAWWLLNPPQPFSYQCILTAQLNQGGTAPATPPWGAAGSVTVGDGFLPSGGYAPSGGTVTVNFAPGGFSNAGIAVAAVGGPITPTVQQILQSLPGYNGAVQQILEHAAGGGLDWVNA